MIVSYLDDTGYSILVKDELEDGGISGDLIYQTLISLI